MLKARRALGRIGKRRRFIIASVLLTLLVFFGTFLQFEHAQYFIVPVGVVAYLLTYFSILEGIDKHEWIMLALHPVVFSIVFFIFYFFLPGRWLTRVPYVSLYAVSVYAIMLSSNIFNVGAVKNLQLFRAAFSINYLFLTVTSFLVYNIVLSFRLNPIYNAVLFFVLTVPLTVQFLWSVNPSVKLEHNIAKYGALIALLIAEVGVVFSFVPVNPTIFALLLTACFYSFSGLFYAYVEDRLFRERIREYLIVLAFVFVITVLSVRWG